MRRFIFAVGPDCPSCGSGLCRRAHHVERRRSGCSLSRILLEGPKVGRAGRHRWALPLSLHASPQYHSAEPDLRHIPRRTRLPCAHCGRPIWTEIPLSRNNARHQRHLSASRSRMDQAQWRLDAERDSAERQGACQTLSALLLELLSSVALRSQRRSATRSFTGLC